VCQTFGGPVPRYPSATAGAGLGRWLGGRVFTPLPPATTTHLRVAYPPAVSAYTFTVSSGLQDNHRRAHAFGRNWTYYGPTPPTTLRYGAFYTTTPNAHDIPGLNGCERPPPAGLEGPTAPYGHKIRGSGWDLRSTCGLTHSPMCVHARQVTQWWVGDIVLYLLWVGVQCIPADPSSYMV